MRTYKTFGHRAVRTTPVYTGTVILTQPSPVENFLFEEYEKNGSKIMAYHSDIAIFFNQERLQKLNPTLLQQLVGQVRPVVSKDVSDEVLQGAIKSRYIQSNCDMYNYTQAVMNDMNSEIAEIREVAEARAAQASVQASPQSDAGSGSNASE